MGVRARHTVSGLAGCVVALCGSRAAAQPAGQPEAEPAAQSTAVSASNAGGSVTSSPASDAQQMDAAVPADQAEDTLRVPTERRGGFVLGWIAGGSLGAATGNPDDKGKRTDPAFERSTGLATGYRLTPFFGGALTDWFTFGLGLSFGSLVGGEETTGITTFVFHLEAFPLFGEGGVYRDLGLTADFGAGSSSIEDQATGEKVAASGVASTAGLGAFWEPVRFWNLAGGPYLGYQHNWSRWYARDDITLGLRIMFYGQQP